MNEGNASCVSFVESSKFHATHVTNSSDEFRREWLRNLHALHCTLQDFRCSVNPQLAAAT
jgi:hypothetical protein